MSILPSSAAVQARLQELREKEEQEIAKRHAEALEKSLQLEKEERERIEEVKRVVAASIVDWEAEILLALEKIPNLLEIIKNPTLISHSSGGGYIKRLFNNPHEEKKDRIYHQPFQIGLFLSAAMSGNPEANIPTTVTVEHEQARFRLRTVARIIQETTAKDAHIKAEAAAAAAQDQRIRRKAALEEWVEKYYKSIKAPYHSFTGVDQLGDAMFVTYDLVSKQLRGQRVRAIIGPGDSVMPSSHYEFGAWMKAPTTWNKMYEEGRLPFLTCCPVCSDQIRFQFRRIDEWGHHGPEIWDVACVSGHYRWDPATNLHYRNLNPPMHNTNARGLLWDPRDPDGSIAAAAALEAKIAAKEAEVAKLQAELEVLRRS